MTHKKRLVFSILAAAALLTAPSQAFAKKGQGKNSPDHGYQGSSHSDKPDYRWNESHDDSPKYKNYENDHRDDPPVYNWKEHHKDDHDRDYKNDRKYDYGHHHGNGNNLYDNDNYKKHKGSDYDRNHDGNSKHKSKRYNFDLHIPGHLKYTRARLPIFIVLDRSGKYRGQSAERFFQAKAKREGFILAYTYDRSYGNNLSNRDKDYIVNSILNRLDGHYRINTNNIRFYFND